MAWLILVMAGGCELVWALGLKYSHGFTKLLPSVVTVVFAIVSMVLLAKAMKTLPIGTAYTVWTGIGAVGTVIAGIILFKEPADLVRLLCVGMIIGGIIGLKIIEPAG